MAIPMEMCNVKVEKSVFPINKSALVSKSKWFAEVIAEDKSGNIQLPEFVKAADFGKVLEFINDGKISWSFGQDFQQFTQELATVKNLACFLKVDFLEEYCDSCISNFYIPQPKENMSNQAQILKNLQETPGVCNSEHQSLNSQFGAMDIGAQQNPDPNPIPNPPKLESQPKPKSKKNSKGIDGLKQEILDEIREDLMEKIKEELLEDEDFLNELKEELKEKIIEELKNELENDDSLKEEIAEELKESLKDEIAEDLKESIKEEIEDEIKESIKDEIAEELKESLKEEIAEEIKEELREELKEELIAEFTN